MFKASVIILSNEPKKYIEDILKHLPASFDNIILDTSGDTAYSISIASKYGARVVSFPPEKFDHGSSRNFGLSAAKEDIAVFLTQDSIPEDGAVERLVKEFENNEIAVAYGRQLPTKNATPIATHARLFNYPEVPYIRVYSDRSKFGIKTAFNSNSFSAYRKKALLSVGGFPEDVILSEDMVAAAKLLKKGFKLTYVSAACAYHSHNYSIYKEFQRYFDIGVFHKKEKWIIEEFGKAEGEGLKFVLSEVKYLLKNGFWYLIPLAFLRNLGKYKGYFLGKHYSWFPLFIRKALSMNKKYWK